MNALVLLKKDHRTVDTLFEQFQHCKDDAKKVTLAQQLCLELTIHAECEERVFYPAARKALGEKSEDLVNEALVEHRSLKALIAEIDGSSPDDLLFEANVKVLQEFVEHHVKEEEKEMFPKLEDKLDLDAVGAKLAEMKHALQAKLGEPRQSRAGARPTVHVPSLSGKARSSSSKSTTSRSANGAKTSSRGPQPAH